MGFSTESGKHLWFGNFSNLKLDTRLPTQKIQKLDVDAFSEEGKNLSSKFTFKFSLAEIVEDQPLAI